MTDAAFKHLQACYKAACDSLQREFPSAAQRQIALDSANRLWNQVAYEVSLRAIASHTVLPVAGVATSGGKARRAATRADVLSDVDPVVLEVWKRQGRKVGAMLREAQGSVIELQEQIAAALADKS